MSHKLVQILPKIDKYKLNSQSCLEPCLKLMSKDNIGSWVKPFAKHFNTQFLETQRHGLD